MMRSVASIWGLSARSALSTSVRENDHDHLFVQTAAGQFRLVPVELGPASRGLRPVLKGPAAGTPVVVEGAFHLNNERKRAELE
jgi:cobalt-zinc-cadmium efflux system membrane fusion protein